MGAGRPTVCSYRQHSRFMLLAAFTRVDNADWGVSRVGAKRRSENSA